jgi:hypothetical protein
LLGSKSAQFADGDLRIILDGDSFGLPERERGASAGRLRIRQGSGQRRRLRAGANCEKGDG